MMEAFRAVLEQWLARPGATQAKLSRGSGIPQNVISRWLDTKPTKPTMANLRKLAPSVGIPYEDLMRLCGYLPGEPQPQPDAKRQAQHKTLDEWLTAVGTEHEDAFWDALKAEAETTRALIDRLRTAVNLKPDTAVKTVPSDPITPPRKRRQRRVPPLSVRLHHALAA